MKSLNRKLLNLVGVPNRVHTNLIKHFYSIHFLQEFSILHRQLELFPQSYNNNYNLNTWLSFTYTEF